ncbi:hypothetical protein [Planobispora rosea]|uniref:hypothetical protein n=1 Tax=Planobispora rosea TaxID=35762 RepID=UPI00083B9979|nr:hypothetical protein [Planobispora rosea]
MTAPRWAVEVEGPEGWWRFVGHPGSDKEAVKQRARDLKATWMDSRTFRVVQVTVEEVWRP